MHSWRFPLFLLAVAAITAHGSEIEATLRQWRLSTDNGIEKGSSVRLRSLTRDAASSGAALDSLEQLLLDDVDDQAVAFVECSDGAFAVKSNCSGDDWARSVCVLKRDHALQHPLSLFRSAPRDAVELTTGKALDATRCKIAFRRPTLVAAHLRARVPQSFDVVMLPPSAPTGQGAKRPGRRRAAFPNEKEKPLEFIDSEFASFFAASTTLGSNRPITRLDKAMETGWRLAKLQRQQALDEITGGGSGGEQAADTRETLKQAQALSAGPALTHAAPAPGDADGEAAGGRSSGGSGGSSSGRGRNSLDSVLLQVQDYLDSGDGVGVSTGFIVMALMEGFAPKAVKKAVEKLSNIFENKLIPIVEDQLGGSPKPVPQGKGGGKGKSKLADGPGALAIGISKDMIKSTPLIVKAIADVFASLMSLDLHNSMVAKLRDPLRDSITAALDKVLTNGLGFGIREIVPPVLERVLPPAVIAGAHKTLLETLTRGVTHSLSATLLHTLRDGPRVEVDCWLCQYRADEARCAACWRGDPLRQGRHFAAQYTHRDAAFYSDYYATMFLAPPDDMPKT